MTPIPSICVVAMRQLIARATLPIEYRLMQKASLQRNCAQSKNKPPCRTQSSQLLWTSSRTTIRNSTSTAAVNSQHRRVFHSTPEQLKKKAKAGKEARATARHEDSDPRDFSMLTDGMERALLRLEKDLSCLRTGARFNPEVLENVRVQLGKGTQRERLGDLAQVLPKGGRSILLIVGEKNHVKPIISAIQATPDLNLHAQVDAHDPQQVNVPLPAPTKESRDAAIATAGKAGEMAGLAVRSARAAAQKRLRTIELMKLSRPDDLKKAHKEMEKLVEKAVADIKRTVDAARKIIQ